MSRAILGIVRHSRLVWRLMADGRVPRGLKLLIPASLLYLLLPIDFVPDFIPVLGQLDDIAVILLALRLFLALCPRILVEEHLRHLSSAEARPSQESPGRYIEGSYRVRED